MNKIKNILLTTTLSASVLFSINLSLATNNATVKAETVNLRASASANSKILEQLSADDTVEILEKSGDWYKVKYKSIEGYLRNDLVTVNGDVSETPKQEEQKTEEPKTEQTNTEPEKQENAENKQEENKTEESPEQASQNNENKQEEKSKIGNYKVKEEINLKILPLIQSKAIGTLKVNNTVKVTDIKNNWAYIEDAQGSGWVNINKIEYIENEVAPEKAPEAEKTAEENEANKETEVNKSSENEDANANTTGTASTKKTKYVDTEAVNIRSQANKTSEVLKSITRNTEVTVLEEANGWSKVEVNGVKGYILSQLLSDTKKVTSRSSGTVRREETENTNTTSTTNTATSEEPATTTNSGKGSQVVSYAKQYLGCKYVYGGTTPSGFDCSGFTQYVYKHFGVSINRTAAAQYSNGKSVTSLQAGDLVMFGKSGINHVGIYIGGGTFIHAANPSKGVRTDTLNSGYYKTNYVGARRIF